MKRKQHKILPPPLQVSDFICRRCRVQATCDGDHICGICKALGQSAEPEMQKAQRRENNLAAMLTKPIVHWLEGHHFIVFGEAATINLKEK